MSTASEQILKEALKAKPSVRELAEAVSTMQSTLRVMPVTLPATVMDGWGQLFESIGLENERMFASMADNFVAVSAAEQARISAVYAAVDAVRQRCAVRKSLVADRVAMMADTTRVAEAMHAAIREVYKSGGVSLPRLHAPKLPTAECDHDS
jgi:hypothetical protein